VIAVLLLWFSLWGVSTDAAELLPLGDFSAKWEGMCHCHYRYGMADLHNHVTQSFYEKLSRDIRYQYRFHFMNHLFGHNIHVLLVPEDVEFPPKYLVNEECSLLDSVKDQSILVQSVLDSSDAPKLYSPQWESIEGKFTGKGIEAYFALENPVELTHRVDNARVWCEPTADFAVNGYSKILALNGIQWKAFTPSQYPLGTLDPLKFWNSVKSKWRLVETDSFGKPITGYQASATRNDSPSLGIKDSSPLAILPLAPLTGLRYFKVIHEDACAHYSKFEASFDDHLMIRFPPEVRVRVEPIPCSDFDKKLKIRIEFPGSLEGLETDVEVVLSGPSGEIDRRVFKIDAALDLEYPNPRVAGSYALKVSTRITGEPVTQSVSKTFSILPPELKIQAPSSAFVGAPVDFFADTGSAPIVPIRWKYRDEQQVLKNFSDTSNRIRLSWGDAGIYQVEADASWNEQCVARDTTQVEVQEIEPRVDLAVNTQNQDCDSGSPLEVRYHIDPGLVTVKAFTVDWFKNGIRVKSQSLLPTSGSTSFDPGHEPGDYRAEFRLKTEAKPGFEKTWVYSKSFVVAPLSPEAIDIVLSPYGKRDQAIDISWLRVGRGSNLSPPNTKVWTYRSETGQLLLGPMNADRWQKTWTERGSFPVSLETRWSNECVAKAQREIRIIGDLSVFVPNAFTPQGDRLNEVFRPVSLDVKDTRFLVLNRWGEILYRESAPDAEHLRGWDGTYGGKPAPDGVYVWKFEGSDYITKKPLQFTGTVHLLR
jgi:gliding motility-associated-like protein